MDVTFALKELNKDEINIIKEFLKLTKNICKRNKKNCWGCPFQMRDYENTWEEDEYVCCSLEKFVHNMKWSELKNMTGEDSLN